LIEPRRRFNILFWQCKRSVGRSLYDLVWNQPCNYHREQIISKRTAHGFLTVGAIDRAIYPTASGAYSRQKSQQQDIWSRWLSRYGDFEVTAWYPHMTRPSVGLFRCISYVYLGLVKI